MKKPVIILIASLVLAGSSLGTFMAVKNKKDSELAQQASQREDNVLFSFNADSVKKLEFEIDGENYTAEIDENKVWSLSNRDDFDLDQVYMQLICTYTSTLTAETCYGNADDKKKAMYGFDDPTVIKITDDSKTYELIVGDESPTGDFYYVMTGEKPNIYAIESIKGTALIADRLTLKSKSLVPYADNEIDTITVKQNGSVVCELKYDTESQLWGLEKKYDSLKTDPTAISSAISNLVRLEAEDMLDENLDDLKKYGFDKPDSEVIVKGLNGTQRSFKVKKMPEDPSYSYVLIGEDNQVEMYRTANLSIADNTIFDYIIQKISGEDMFSVTGFDIKIGSIDEIVSCNYDKDVCEVGGKTIDVSSTEADTLFRNFYNSFTDIPIAGVDTDASPKEEDPVLSVIYHTKENGDSTLSVTNGGNGKFYIFRNGSYTGAYADEERFTGRTSVEEFYKKLTDYSS